MRVYTPENKGHAEVLHDCDNYEDAIKLQAICIALLHLACSSDESICIDVVSIPGGYGLKVWCPYFEQAKVFAEVMRAAIRGAAHLRQFEEEIKKEDEEKNNASQKN